MLTIERLHKTYPGGIRALNDVSLLLQPGIYGLLGPNGAGKSTMMKILATLLRPDEGTVRLTAVNVLEDPKSARRLLGYLPQNFGLYPTFTAAQMLDHFVRLKGIHRRAERVAVVDGLLDRVNLSMHRDDRIATFSGGMLQRLGIAQALIASPRLLIVDEPTAGLDPEERLRFHNLLAEIADAETVVLLSTHMVGEVGAICAGIGVMLRGELVTSVTPGGARAALRGRVWEATLPRETVRRIPAAIVLSTQVTPGGVIVRIVSDVNPSEQFDAVIPTLEDYYMSVLVSRS